MIDETGHLHVEHHVADKMNYTKEFTLSPGEARECWALIDAAAIPSLQSSARPGVPDESRYKLVLDTGGRVDEVEIWANDARSMADLNRLLAHLKTIIHARSKRTVVI